MGIDEMPMIWLRCISLIGLIFADSAAMAQTAVERGEYLVNGIMTCGNCHTPRGPGGTLDMARQLSGGPQTWDRPSYTVKASNITPDRETGIGTWTDAELKRALTEGIRPNDVPLAPVMPSGFYKVLTSRDLNAIVAYLRSIAPVRNEVQTPQYKAEMPIQPYPGAERPMTDDDLRDPVKRGYYLASLGHCMLCHTPLVNGRPDYRGSHGKGGIIFRGPFGEARASNITSHKVTGIGDWTDAEIKRAITEGVSRDGRPLKVMAFNLYARLTSDDLHAIVAWLRTLPPLE
jgi:mono/diheme cytochrome c family protein